MLCLAQGHLDAEKEVFAGDGVVSLVRTGVVSPVSADVVRVGVDCVGKCMRQLEEAVLDVLVEAKCDGECPGVAGISGRAGMMERAWARAWCSPVSAGVVRSGKCMRQLEEAVLDVLVEAKCDGECPGVAGIGRRAGMFSGRGRGVPGERR